MVNIQAPEAPKHPLWTFRSKEEAEQHWKSQYGAANFEGAPPEGRKNQVHDERLQEQSKTRPLAAAQVQQSSDAHELSSRAGVARG